MAQSKYEKKNLLQKSKLNNYTAVFRFSLPDGLSLRSVRVVENEVEFWFSSSPKVPTLQESDIAAAFRLASEKERPEFGYVHFPRSHPFHGRWFNYYSPQWLRGTSFGELLADVDWSMKCLEVGARSNEHKTTFKSWCATSNLKGLATKFDFPVRHDVIISTIKMYCDHAKVQKTNNEYLFPEEPKMKIVSECQPQYSKYITEHLPKVAYHDEPKFLKMQEIIKLILAVEWLYNEKNVRVNKNWIKFHTKCNAEEKHALIKSFPVCKKTPQELIPIPPPDFKPPSKDVFVSTNDEELDLALPINTTVLCGYKDFGGCEAKIFTDKGEKLYSQDCLKCTFIMHTPVGIKTGHHYLRKDDEYIKTMFKLINFPVNFEGALCMNIPNSNRSNFVLNKEHLMVQFSSAPSINLGLLTQECKTLHFESSSIVSSTHYSASDLIPFAGFGVKAIEKASKDMNFFGPVEDLIRKFEDPLAGKSELPNKDKLDQTIITCFEKMYKAVIENSCPYPATARVSVDEFCFDKDKTKFSMSMSVIRHAPLSLPHFELTATLKVAQDDLNFLFSHIDPNEALAPGVIPGVSSMEELFFEMTTPLPTVLQYQHRGMGLRTTSGGIVTKDIPTVPIAASATAVVATSIFGAFGYVANARASSSSEFKHSFESTSPTSDFDFSSEYESSSEFECSSEQKPTAETNSKSVKTSSFSQEESQQKRKRRNKYRESWQGYCDDYHIAKSTFIEGNIVLATDKQKDAISKRFQNFWGGNIPEIITIFRIVNTSLRKKWKGFGKKVSQDYATSEEYYHGSTLHCDIVNTKMLCQQEDCGTCHTANVGFNEITCKAHSSYSRFQKKVILNSYPSTSDSYNENDNNEFRAIILCDVLPGRKYDRPTQAYSHSIPEGYHSMCTTTSDDHMSPLLVHAYYEAVLPSFIIIYKPSN